jgi:hypothetical protein
MTRSPMPDAEVARLLRETYAATSLPEGSTPTVPDVPVPAHRRPMGTWAIPLVAAAVVVLISGLLFLTRPVWSQAGDQGPAATHAQVTTSELTATPGPVPSPTPWAVKLSPPPPTHRPKGLTADQLQSRLGETAERIDKLAAAHDPDFAFTSLEDAKGTKSQYVDGLAIYRATADPGNLAALYATVVPKGMTISYGRTLLSNRQIVHLTELLQAQNARFRQLGIHLTHFGGVGFSDYGGRFEIGYDNAFKAPGPALLKPLEIYGPDTIVLVPGPSSVREPLRESATQPPG